MFETPRLPAAQRAARRPQSFTEQVEASFEAMRNLDNFNAESHLRDRIWQERIDEVESVTGVRLPHPNHIIPDTIVDEVFMAVMGASDETGGRDMFVRNAEWLNRRIDELRAERPEYGTQIRDRDAWEEVMRDRAADIHARASEAEFIPGLIGGFGGAFTDPVNIATLPLGFAGRTVPIAKIALGEAAINAGVELANVPLANAWRQELGLDPITLEEGVYRVGGAALFGAVVGGGLPAAGRALDSSGLAMSRIPGLRNQEWVRAAAMRDALRQETREALTRLPPRRLVRAHHELVTDPTPSEIDARGVLDREIEIEDVNPIGESIEDSVEHRTRLDAAMEIAERADEPTSRALAAMERSEAPPDAIPEDLAGLPEGTVFELQPALDPMQILVDAERFQFKSGGDAEGVSDRLAGVQRWDSTLAGEIMVWQDLDGRLFVVDGHQRTGLARRLITENPEMRDEIRIRAIIHRESDGLTASDMRAIAAMRNLAEGTGTAIDAAKVLRERPDLLTDAIPMRSALMRDATGLMRLGDGPFQMTVNELVPANYAAIVGRMVDLEDEQTAIMQVLARVDPSSAYEAESIVRQALAAGFQREETVSLFGSEAFASSLIGERAKVLSNAARILRQDRRIFATLTEEAERIESAGNRLSRDTNQERANANAVLLETLQKLATRRGPVSDALNEAARAVADGQTAARAARDFTRRLDDLLSDGGLDRLLADGAGSPVSPAGSRAPDSERRAEIEPDPSDEALDAFDAPAGDGARAQAERLDEEGRLEPFNEWIENSRVLDDSGAPLIVYRGEHGAITERAKARSEPEEPTTGQDPSREEIGNRQFQTRLASLSFGSREAASLYSVSPNNPGDIVAAPRVFPVYLQIRNPVVSDAADPFIDMPVLIDVMGEAPAIDFARRHSDALEATSNWEDNFAADFDSVADLLDRAPDRLGELYLNAYHAFDDFAFVESARRAGYDGGIMGGVGETALEVEYRIFDERQARSAFGVDPTRPPLRSDAARLDEDLADPDPAAKAELMDIVDRGASLEELQSNPLIRAREEDMAGRGDSLEAYNNLATDEDAARWMDEAQFDVPGVGPVTGVIDAVDAMVERQRFMGWWDDDLTEAMPDDWRPAQDRQAYILVGWPAAGKSTLANPIARRTRSAIIDSDEFKKIIPGYDDGAGASFTHRQSSRMNDLALRDLARQGDNLVLPTVGQSADHLMPRIDALREQGYTINLIEMVVPREEAIRRNAARFVRSNRLVPLALFDTEDVAISATYRYMVDEGLTDANARIGNTQPFGRPPEILEDKGGLLDGIEEFVPPADRQSADAGIISDADEQSGVRSPSRADGQEAPGAQSQDIDLAGSGENALPGQTLIPGVAPVARAQRDALDIANRQAAPLRGGDAEPGGLFGEPQSDLFDATPVGARIDEDGRDAPVLRSDEEIDADLAQEDALIERLRGCVK